jgi:amino-acid N-acetyltransferase
MARICRKIEAGQCDRVHILPAGKNTIKHELFTVEGAGTLIANNFQENFRQVRTDEEVAIVHRILEMYKRSGFLKPRSKAYLKANRHRFYVTAIDGIVVGCVEQKIIDEKTVELGALAISTRFRNQRVGVHTVESFMALMRSTGIHALYFPDQQPPVGSAVCQLGLPGRVLQSTGSGRPRARM